jgi:signal transduction histidine kinase
VPPDLHRFLRENRSDIIDDWVRRVAAELTETAKVRAELVDRVPMFLGELIADLQPEQSPPYASDNAVEHGEQRLRIGFSVGQVAREYGLLHDCILAQAAQAGVHIQPHEHRLIAARISSGTATAVAQYVAERDAELQRESSEHLGFIAHELRGPLSTARMALDILGRAHGEDNRFIGMVDRAIKRAAALIDSTLTHAWLKLGIEPQRAPVHVRALVDELFGEMAIERERKGVQLLRCVDDDLHLEADPRLLRSAVSNLLHNAIKFTRPHTTVTVRARAANERTIIEVEDGCGGLPPGRTEDLFEATVQRGEDRSGSGLGLAIAKQAVAAHGGAIMARDLPGRGCVFAIELPR